MRRNFTYALLIGTLLLNLTGCAGLFGVGGTLEKRRNLANGVEKIGDGLESEARHFFELVIENPQDDGVTDEALFRLAILNLNDGKLGGGKSSIALLDTLQRSYPKSVWAQQAEPLLLYLKGPHSIRSRERELTSLREKNFALNREVRELRQVIERLKMLDRELELKIKH